MAYLNPFNIENLDVPNTSVRSSAFGRITATQRVSFAPPNVPYDPAIQSSVL